MDLPSLLNTKGVAASAERPFQHQLADATHGGNRSMPARDGLHMSDRSSKFSARPEQHRLQLTTTMATAPHYTDSPQVLSSFMMPNPYPTPTTSYDTEYSASITTDDGRRAPTSTTSEGATPVKAFACSSCGKGFARRSDLARHERIHTGVRPHICEYSGCKKQFIQRSALTVHARVHTGEKPHMCEHCTKPFSDSSSLARHRRIHSGKRPYKCPYADCQKTFTRRTTLTRHMSHHTGTVEEAAAATAAALASRPPHAGPRSRSDGDAYSDPGSNRSTPEPSRRNMSASPSNESPHIPALLPRHSSSSDFFLGGRTLPPHMRGDHGHHLQQHSPRSSTGSSSPSSAGFGPGSQQSHRPSLTSHPVGLYGPPPLGPPPILEPPTNHDSRSTGSASGSPHLGSVGWQSPLPTGSPAPHDGFGMYGESFGHASGGHWGYAHSHLRRPQSTEPDHYETKPRLVSNEVWSGPM